MKREGLCVGNHVIFNGENCFIAKGEAIDSASKFKGRELTNEILYVYGFGFSEPLLAWVLQIGNFRLEFAGVKERGMWLNGVPIEINYLHELQNLYRLLSGGLELQLIDV